MIVVRRKYTSAYKKYKSRERNSTSMITSKISMLWQWISGSPLITFEIGIDKSITAVEEPLQLDKFYMTLQLSDSVKFTYDPSNYTRPQYNEYGTRLCGNKIQVFGKAYVETALGVDEILEMIERQK